MIKRLILTVGIDSTLHCDPGLWCHVELWPPVMILPWEFDWDTISRWIETTGLIQSGIKAQVLITCLIVTPVMIPR